MAAVMWLVSVIVMPLLPVMPDMCLSVVEREGPTCRQKVASLCQIPSSVHEGEITTYQERLGSYLKEILQRIKGVLDVT